MAKECIIVTRELVPAIPEGKLWATTEAGWTELPLGIDPRVVTAAGIECDAQMRRLGAAEVAEVEALVRRARGGVPS